ncbi:hypothetical protein SS05631_a46600 (plasmid) [Sinorhizobium sp. CCBAU 05631]|nr:hypothetical protein SS05631_a46600 [Sinorhizobium sp. CCBAU 05631]
MWPLSVFLCMQAPRQPLKARSVYDGAIRNARSEGNSFQVARTTSKSGQDFS